MATFRLRYFSSPSVLRAITPSRLLEFLSPFNGFFAAQGYDLPQADDDRIDYQKLIDIFMSPSESTPSDLVDALYLVDEMSTHEEMVTLIEAAEQEGIVLDDGDEHTPADIAIQIWLQNSELLERKHAEKFAYKPKSFEYYQTDHEQPPTFTSLSASKRASLESDLSDFFETKKRGRGARVFVYPDENEVRFLVRHGEPFKREESLAGTDVGSVCYRPLKYDVIVYDRRLGELRVNARLVGEKKKYRELFGKHVFGDNDCFPGTAKYTLEPLRELGADALACFDVDGIESIVLTEVDFFWGGAQGEIEIRKATDVFAALEARGRTIPERARIIKAVFKVKFADSKTPRSVKICPSNVAEYGRDHDASMIEEWLRLRGFLRNTEIRQNVAVAEALEVA